MFKKKQNYFQGKTHFNRRTPKFACKFACKGNKYLEKQEVKKKTIFVFGNKPDVHKTPKTSSIAKSTWYSFSTERVLYTE